MLVSVLNCQLTIMCVYSRLQVSIVVTEAYCPQGYDAMQSDEIYHTLWHHALDSSNVCVCDL